MKPSTILLAVSILAAAIVYAGHQLRGETIVASPEHTGDVFGVFQLAGGQVRYCEGAMSVGVLCTAWRD
jgi:hypothetical protein